jgi:hypothetical protein
MTAMFMEFLTVLIVSCFAQQNLLVIVIPRRLVYICRRFGTLYRFHLQRQKCECDWRCGSSGIYTGNLLDWSVVGPIGSR